MESWNLNRVHRFKNLLAFLLVSFDHIQGFDRCLHDISPATLEEGYLRYLGENLPTEYEYSIGLSPEITKKFDIYCDRWVSPDIEDE